MILSPMLANPLAIEDISKKAKGYWMEPKLDGIRCVANWKGEMWSRSAKTNLSARVPHLPEAVLQLDLPQGVWLDGELGYVGPWGGVSGWPIVDFNRTVRVTGSGVDEAIRKQVLDQFMGRMKFFVFDYLLPDKAAQSQAFRSGVVDGLLSDFMTIGGSHVVAVPQQDGWNEEIYDQYVLAGGEGVILKNPSGFYIPGKRPTKTWYKIKKFDTFDGVICEDYDPGQGKYEGQVGAIVVRHPEGFDVRASGMTDAVRLDMTKNWSKYQLKMVEIKYFGLTAGTPRHPQFLRMRPDLD